MLNVFKTHYWSKSEAFLLPLTNLTKTQKYTLNSYLFWEDYSIEDYNMAIKFKWDNYDEFVNYCKRVVFPTLDKNGYITETFDFEGETVFILNMSDWAMDIEMFLKGKYSKMSKEARKLIKEYHIFYDKGPKLDLYIRCCLEPTTKFSLLDDMTPIEYVCRKDTYGIKQEDLEKIGEIGSIYDKKEETLVLDSATMTDKYDRNDICTI